MKGAIDMIDFGDTLKLLDEEPVQEQKVRYKGDSYIYQEAKKAKADVDDEEPGTSEKYDDKYDLDNDQGATIEPADVDVDDDFDYGSSDEDDEDSDDKGDKKDDKKKSKKKSSKKKDTKDDDTDKNDTSDDNDKEIDVEEEGFKEGIKETGHQIVKGLKTGFQDIGSGIKDRFDDAADDIDKIKNAGSFGGAVKETLNTLPRAYKHDYDMEDKWARNAAQSRMDSRNAIFDAFESKNKVDKAARTAKRKAGEAVRDAGTKVGDKISESYYMQEAYQPSDLTGKLKKAYFGQGKYYPDEQYDEIVKKTIAGAETFFEKHFHFPIDEIRDHINGIQFDCENETYKVINVTDPIEIIEDICSVALYSMWKELEIETVDGFETSKINDAINCSDLSIKIGKARKGASLYNLILNWNGNTLCVYITHGNDNDNDDPKLTVKELLNSKKMNVAESYRYQEAAALIKKTAKQDIDEAMESRLGENNYYTFIANSSKDLEHLYKTLMKRASKEAILEEMTNIFNELKERRESYYSSKHDDAHDPKRSYQGLKRVIDQDIENIEKNIEILSDPKNEKPSKSLMKKTIKMINNLQQDMITECERSQPMVIRHVRDIAKKLWLFEYDMDEADGNVTMESGEDAMFAKVGEMLVHYRKQKELQDLAEKNGVEINGMRLTDDTIMNIVTSCVALMLAKEEGDPRYHQLVDQGMRKRSLKVDIINSYKSRANDLINRYDHGPIVGAEPYRRDIEVISDEDEPEYEEEFYLDENGEMQSSYYQEGASDEFEEKMNQLPKEYLDWLSKDSSKYTDGPAYVFDDMDEPVRFYDKKQIIENLETDKDIREEGTDDDKENLYSENFVGIADNECGDIYLMRIGKSSAVYLWRHEMNYDSRNKMKKIASSWDDFMKHVVEDKQVAESWYYQESDEDDSDTNLDEDDEANDPEKDTDNKSKDEDNSEDDDKDTDTDDDEEDIDDEDNDNDDEDDSKDDDDEDDELEEEFYIDPDTGELKSSWYAEMDESYDGAGAVSNSKRKDPDELIEWEVKPGKEVEDIEFGATRTKTQKKLEKDFGQPKKSTVEMDDYGKFIVYYESDKVARVTIIKDIQIELDRSIVFPGKIDNLRKKALDIKPEGDNKLVSKIMSIEVVLNSDDTINSITFARRQYYSDKSFQKFDKVSWHTDQGMDEKNVIKRFKEVYKFLDKHALLTPAGKDEMKHIGSDSVLTTNEVIERGAQFLRIYYDKCMQYDYHTIRNQLEQCWRQFTSQSYSKGE